MIVRIRSRDGVERVEVPAGGTVGDLYDAVVAQLNIPQSELMLSKDRNLLLSSASVHQFADLTKRSMRLSNKAGIENGTIVYAYYTGERTVPSAYRKSKFEERAFGNKMTVEEMVAQQVRIERQERAAAASVSFDYLAARAFQAYVRSALAFSVKRGGILYGTVAEDLCVKVEFVYEPQQQSTTFELVLEMESDEHRMVDDIADALGLKKVGWIFSQSSEERDFIVSAQELMQMAMMQDAIGETAITAVVSLDMSEDGGHVHFEAYQCSKQCVSLWGKNWFSGGDSNVGVVQMRNPYNPADKTPVIVVGKDVAEVDNDFFLCPVNILDHEGPLKCSFPIENRLVTQGRSDLKKTLQSEPNQPYHRKLADFHLLLYLSCKLERNDLMAICASIRKDEPILEGYQFLIDSLADM